jgi:hypothetical protein
MDALLNDDFSLPLFLDVENSALKNKRIYKNIIIKKLKDTVN